MQTSNVYISKMPSNTEIERNIPESEKIIQVRPMANIETYRSTQSYEKVSYQEMPANETISFTPFNQEVQDVPIINEEIEIEEVYREVEIEYIVEKPVKNIIYVDVPVDRITEKRINKTIERDIITEIEIDQPTEVVVEVPIPRIVKRPVQKIIERQKSVDVVIENPIEVKVPRYIEREAEVESVQQKYYEVDETQINKFSNAIILETQVNVLEQQNVKEIKKSVKKYVDRPVVKTETIEVIQKIPQIIEKIEDEIVE